MNADQPLEKGAEESDKSADNESIEQISMKSFSSASRHQFYEGAERGQILDVLPLLQIEEKNCVIIEGDPGIGKTSLAHQIYVQTQEHDQKAIMIHGSELATSEDRSLMQKLLHHLGLDEDKASTLENGQSLAELYNESSKAPLVLVVDDAQQLSSIAVTLLVDFLYQLPRKRAQLILLALPGAPVLLADSTLQDYLSDYGHGFILRPFNSKETSDYVRFLLIAAERDNVKLSRQALSRIFQMSGGVPSKINEGLVYALQDYDQQPVEKENQRSEIVPKWHLVSLCVVAAGVVALIVFGNPDNSSDQRFSETIRKMPEEPSDYQASPPIRFTDAQAPQRLDPDSQNIAENMQNSGRSQVNTAMPSNDPLRARVEQGVEDNAVPSAAEQDQSNKVSMDAKLAKLKAQQEAIPEPVASTPAASARPSAPSQASAAPASRSTQASSEETAQWVKAMSPQHYTLQLLGGANKSAIEKFVAENGSYHKMGYFETELKGRPWYVVVYGDFASREQAVAAVSQLPGQLRSSNPWPRSAADIQSKIR